MSVSPLCGASVAPNLFEHMPNEILTLIFWNVITSEGAPSLHRARFGNYCLVSKRFYAICDDVRLRCQWCLLPYLSQQGIIPDIWLSKRDERHETPLFGAIRNCCTQQGSIENVESLLRAGAELNIVNRHSHSPLCVALLQLDEEKPDNWQVIIQLVTLLLKYGAVANGPDKKSPLLMVVYQAPSSRSFRSIQAELVKILSDAGADPYKKVVSPIRKTPISAYERVLNLQHPSQNNSKYCTLV